MNLLLIYQNELLDADAEIIGDYASIKNARARLIGARAQWAYETFRPKAGDVLVCGLLNAKIGEALIVSATKHEIIADIKLWRDPPARFKAEIIVGLSRPQTIKKVLQFAASVGIATVRLVRCEGSEKSYLDSHLLRDLSLSVELDLGLCQGVDTVRPNVLIHQSISECVQDFLSTQTDSLHKSAGNRWVGALMPSTASVTSTDNTDKMAFATNEAEGPSFAVAVGPEKGFYTHEIELLRTQAGFRLITLGARQLRVEFALAALVGRCLQAHQSSP